MNTEIAKQFLILLFGERLIEVSPEVVEKIARKVAEVVA